MKLFGFGKVKDKLLAQRFEFTLTVHNLQPWPAGNRAIAIGWQRGKKKRGATRSVFASTAPGKLGAVVRFNEKFELTATLYKAHAGGSSNAAQIGPFKKKCLILAVLETDGRTQATAALGRVVVDLAEFAAIEGQETRLFQVTANKQIHAAVGDPQLLMTIRTRWKKSSQTVGATPDALGDEGSSMSTDTTGSRMTANLSSFLRFKHSGKGPANEEQDLQGFDPKRGEPELRHPLASMGTIDEGHDELPDSPGAAAAGANPLVPGQAPRAGMHTTTTRSAAPATPQTRPLGRDTYDSDGFLRDSDVESSPGMGAAGNILGGGGLRSRHAAAAAAPSPAAAAAAPGASPYRSGVPSSSPLQDGARSTPTRSNGGEEWQPARVGGSAPAATLPPAGAAAVAAAPEAVRLELLTSAAAEACVHLARAAAGMIRAKRGPSGEPRAAHLPARRLARTLACLGPAQGAAVGQHLLQLIQSQLDVCTGELQPHAFWWSNLVHLRALLQSASSTGSSAAAVGWASPRSAAAASLGAGIRLPPQLYDALAPTLQRMERTAFERVLNYLWADVMLPSLTGGAGGAATGAGVAAGAKPTASTKRAQQEAAIKRWFSGLDDVSRTLTRCLSGSTCGRGALLRQQLLGQCLKRVDALLFHHLLAGDTPVDVLQDYDPGNSLWGEAAAGGAARGPPQLDDASLPFTRGLLTFGSGMSVKMTVTRLQQWASGEGGMGAGGMADGVPGSPSAAAAAAALGGAAPSSLFPLLRAAADLLMMPKELLLEAAIRRDVCQALSLRSMIHILESFQPDEYAGDAISPDILATLRDEVVRGAAPVRPPLSDLSMSYRPPADEVVLVQALSAGEPGLEYDADSEDELESLGTVACMPGASSRFRALHELWAQGAGTQRASAGGAAQ